MRSKLIGLILGCGLVAATIAPAFACQFHVTTASDEQAAPQQTAQAQSQAQTSSQ
jgi:hypothetical protein